MKLRISKRRGPTERRYPFRTWFVAWHREQATGELSVTLHGPRLSLLLAALSLVGWVVVALLAWRTMLLHGYRSVEYTDVVLPWHWSDIRQKRGEDLIRQGEALALNQRWEEAIASLAAGVKRVPKRESYLLLGQICLRTRQEPRAVAYLQEGLGHFQPDQAYLQMLSDACVAADEMETAREVLERYWKNGWNRENVASRQWLAVACGLVLLRLERWSEALIWARDRSHDKEMPTNLAEVEIYALVKLERNLAAIDVLVNQPKTYLPEHIDLIPSIAEAYYLTNGAQQTLRLLQLIEQVAPNSPDRALAAIEFVVTKPELRQTYQANFAAYLERFGPQEEQMAKLAFVLVRHHASPELKQLLAYARSRGYADGRFEIAAAEGLLYDGQYEEAGRVLDTLSALPEGSLREFKAQLLVKIQRRLANTRADDQAGKELLDHVARHRLPLADNLNLANLLVHAGHPAEALQILDLAGRNYPRSLSLAKLRAQLAAAGPAAN